MNAKENRQIELLKGLDNANIDRRKFMKIMAAAGLASFVRVGEANALSSSARGKIVIVGGGAAGLSIAARLMSALDEPDITLIDPSDRQYYQPGFTFVASGVFTPEEVWKKQETCIPKGVKWIKDTVAMVDPVWNQVYTTKGEKVAYDFMVLTPGCQCNWHKIEGLTYDKVGQGAAFSAYDFHTAQKTWQGIQDFSKAGGRGLFVDTYTKYKCGGVPKKITLLTEHYTRKQGTRQNVKLDYITASHELYDIPYYTPRLLDIYKERNVSITLNSRVKGIDLQAKQVHFERITTIGDQKTITPFKEDYDFLHFAPPMSSPDFVRESGLGWETGKLAPEAWVMVDKETFVHGKYKNIISLGDVAGIPTSKTSAAVRMQVPIAVQNLLSMMEGKEPTAKYDGYACCPIVTDYGHVLLAEFDFNKEPKGTFPFTLLDTSKEQYAAWLLKKYVLKPMFFYGMLNGWA